MPHAPLSLVTVPTAASQKGPSRAFFGDKTSAEGDPDVLGSSASSVTSFQTASSAGFSHSIFQQQPKHLLSTSSSLSSVSSVFHVAPSPRTHPHAKRVTSTVVEHEVMMDPWDDDPMQHKQRLRDESVVMMVEGDEEDDVFDHDENAMRTTTVMDNGRLFSECSSRFSILSDSNDTKI
ncbi:hypothetical protein DYB32_003812 [Aphanomyces invadans]|nr:hypothetical protein DYB32_003812 [Aphanomyces invadans]